MHAVAHCHHFSFVNEEAQRLDRQLVFQLQLSAVESFEALLRLVEPHLQVFDGILDGRVGIDEAGLSLVAAQLDTRPACAVLKASLDQLECDQLPLDGLAKLCYVVLHLCDLLLHLHALPSSMLFQTPFVYHPRFT